MSVVVLVRVHPVVVCEGLCEEGEGSVQERPLDPAWNVGVKRSEIAVSRTFRAFHPTQNS